MYGRETGDRLRHAPGVTRDRVVDLEGDAAVADVPGLAEPREWPRAWSLVPEQLQLEVRPVVNVPVR